MKYTDISRIVLPYDSYWSIVNKFCLLNHISPSALRSKLGKELKRGTETSVGKYNFNNSITYSAEKIGRLTGIPHNRCETSSISSILDISDLPFLASVNLLRYCPLCISSGYHAVFYQLYVFSQCPIHHTLLESKCLYCKGEIRYELLQRAVAPYSCTSCGRRLWHRFVKKNGLPVEQLQHLDATAITAFDEVYLWLRRVKLSGVLRSINDFKTMVPTDNLKGSITVESFYSAMSQYIGKLEIPTELDRQDLQHVSVKFGCVSVEKQESICVLCEVRRTCRLKEFYQLSRWSIWRKANCSLDASSSLRPIFNSIRKFFFRLLKKAYNRRCLLPTFATTSYRIPEVCSGCHWSRAFILWREYWSLRLADTHDFWQDLYRKFEMVPDARSAKWAALWIFALECLVTLKRAIYLIHSNSFDCPLGEAGFIWLLEDHLSKRPILHYWQPFLQTFEDLRCSIAEQSSEPRGTSNL